MNSTNWQSLVCDNPNIVIRRLQDLSDVTTQNQLEYGFLKLQRANLEIIQELIDTLAEVTKNQLNKRIVNTTGTSIGAAGALSIAVGVFLAPATGGASLLFVGGGVAASLTGAVMSIGTSVVGRWKNKAFVEGIIKLQQRQNQEAEELEVKLGVINTVTSQLLRAGIPEDVATRAAFSLMRDSVIEQYLMGPNGEISLQKVSKLVQKIVPILRETSGVLSLGYLAIRDKRIVNEAIQLLNSLTAKIGEASARAIEEGGQMVQAAGQGLTSATSKVVLKRAGAVAGIIFTVVDIAFLVKEWKTPDPLIGHIQNIVSILIDDVDKCDKMLDIIRGLSGLPQISL